jgi:hypothetical protein
LSAKLGDLLLTDKEASGLVIKGVGATQVPRPRWAVIGKVCSPRILVIGAFERAMQKAWGLHVVAQFKDLGENRFVVKFLSEGDWKHIKNGGPWQFDFSVVLLKDFDGSIRPSDIVFDTMDIWVRVLDLPMDMMNQVYGELIGGWIGKYISVDVDEEGMAWGKDLRIRVAVRVDQPLVRGVPLKESNDESEGRWFDIKYERVPHFCFDCGRLVHPEGRCSAEKAETKQWREWLRASPKRGYKPPPPARPTVSTGSFSGRLSDYGMRGRDGVYIRDLPPRRALARDFEFSSSSRTGGYDARRELGDVTSPAEGSRVLNYDQQKDKAHVDVVQKK